MNEKYFISCKEASEIIGISAITVRKMILEKKWNIPYLMSGRKMRILYAPFVEMCKTGIYNNIPLVNEE